MKKSEKIIIGVTGGIASGKTTVTEMLVEMGAYRIDADKISHELLENNKSIREKVIKFLGDDIVLEKKINRRKIAEKVFSDPEKLEKLCSIMHTKIISKMKERMLGATKTRVVVDAPLLIETGINEDMDIVIVVRCDRETQIKRALKRGLSEEEVVKIISNQVSIDEKIKHADYVLENNGDLNKLNEGVREIWTKM